MSGQFLLEATEQTIEWARTELELSYEQIGRALGADRRTLRRWLDREHTPSAEHRENLEKLREMRFLLETLFRDAASGQRWLHSPLPALRGRTPRSLLDRGRIDEVLSILNTIRAGAFV